VLLSVEHGTDKQRGRNASFAQMGPSIGVLFATGAIALLTSVLSDAELLDWGWRLPLLASVMLVAFGLWLRLGVTETPQFRALERDTTRSRTPLGEVIREHWRGLLIAGGSRFGPDVMYSLISAFLLAYITRDLMLGRPLATTALAIGAACNAVCIYFAGSLSDRFGRRAVFGGGVAAAFLWLLALFPLLHLKTELAVTAAIVSGLTIHAFMYGPQGAFIAEQFPTRVRYAGSSLAYTIAGVFAGGIAPLAMTGLFREFGTTRVIVMYAATALLITITALAFARPDRGEHAPRSLAQRMR
jgi:MFS family permease